jgi:RHH-type proline utilization regulon transcriptional repressor/proline dehydrogenase/delta 1-pyrroline-5-carboxylate dehydrogenase
MQPAVDLAHRWLAVTGDAGRTNSANDRLVRLVADPAGLDLAVRFIDRVARPEDTRVAAKELATLRTAAFLSPLDRLLLSAGSRLAGVLPAVVVPAARVRLRQLVGPLIGDEAHLERTLSEAREQGFTVNLNLLGEAVLGEQEAARRAARLTALVQRPDVDYVSVKPSALASHLSTWDLAGSRDRLLERLLPLARTSSEHDTFLNLDMEEYKDLDLTLAVFTTLMAELPRARLGVVLQAYLPDALPAFDELTAAAEGRIVPIKVRFVKGANLAMERVDAELHGWQQAPYPTKAEVDANYLRLLDHALQPGRAVRVGLASHNLFHVAHGHLLARERGISHLLDVEVLAGMAPEQARAIRSEVGRVVLYAPVVRKQDFDVAVSYLVRRLEENAAPENFLHALFAAHDVSDQEQAYLDALETLADVGSRRAALPEPSPGFHNTPDTDPSVASNRAWAAAALAIPPGPVRTPLTTSTEEVDRVLAAARAAHCDDPATLLRRAAEYLQRARGALLSTMAHEAGKTVVEADPEISEAIDFANWYASFAQPTAPGATFTPDRVVVIAPPWNFPVAIPLGGAFAAIAAGAAVVLKPAPQTPRCVEVAVGAVHAAMLELGVDPALLQVVRVLEDDVGKHLLTSADRVILTGSLETAQLFQSWGVPLIAETSGKNAMVVTPSADYDLAVADLVKSAFGHAGQKCSAASLVILVGSAGTSERLRRQLVDATRSLRVGPAEDLGTDVGPLIDAPGEKLLRGLTQLDEGESWLVEPQHLGGTLWSPGLRDGVRPGSWFHQTECFGPVLGIMHARSLDEAVDWQNGTAFGLTGGLHSLDEDEIALWLDRVEVGNAYVNKGTTGAIVRRQPFGGWKGSTVGPGAKAGGPHYVAQLGTWAGPVTDLDWAEADDERAWREVFGREHDPSGLAVESNVLRYRPVEHLHICPAPGTDLQDIARVQHACLTAGVRFSVGEPPLQVGPLERIRVIDADHPVLASAERELLTVVREQTVSRTLHRFGHLSGR